MKICRFQFCVLILALGLSGCTRSIEDIEKWKAEANVKKLTKALRDPADEIQIASAKTLGELKAETAVDSLAALYNDDCREVRLAAVEALATINSESIITPMIAALRFDDPEIQLMAIIALGEMKAVGAVDQLSTTVLTDPEIKIQTAAAFALGRIGDEGGSEALIKALPGSSGDFRMVCISSLGQTGGEEAVSTLIGLLNSKDHERAKQSLTRIGSDAAPQLMPLLKSDDAALRAEAVGLLQKMEAVPESGENLIWFKLARVSSKHPETVDAEIIAFCAEPENIDVLIEAAVHRCPDFRRHALPALEKIGKPAADKILKAAEENVSDEAKPWLDGRTAWPGVPAWQLDLWGAATALHPDFQLNTSTAESLKAGGFGTLNLISDSPFVPTREYLPLLIKLLADKKCAPTVEKVLTATGTDSDLPLRAALGDDNELIVEQAARILAERGDPEAEALLLKIEEKKAAAENNVQ